MQASRANTFAGAGSFRLLLVSYLCLRNLAQQSGLLRSLPCLKSEFRACGFLFRHSAEPARPASTPRPSSTPRMNSPRKSGKLNVDTPFTSAVCGTIGANRAAYVVRETAAPSAFSHPAGGVVIARIQPARSAPHRLPPFTPAGCVARVASEPAVCSPPLCCKLHNARKRTLLHCL